MNRLIQYCNEWSSPFVEQGWAIFWQSTLLVAVVASMMWLLQKTSPTLRFWIWQIVAVKLLLLPLWKVDAPQPAWLTPEKAALSAIDITDVVAESPQSLTIEPTLSTEPKLSAPPTQSSPAPQDHPIVFWQTWLVALWFAGIFYQVARLLCQRFQLQKLLLNAQPLPEFAPEVEHCRVRLGLKRSPDILMVKDEISPFVCGLRSSKLILPKSMATSVNPQCLRQIILHELAHIRRRDLLWCWVPSLMQIVYWFHPAARWVARQIQLERELACDQIAMQTSGSTADEYAHTLVDVVSHTASQIAAQAAFSAQFVGETK